MKPSDMTTQEAREFARATVSIRTKIDHTTASHDALVGAIEKDLATNLSTKKAFEAFTANAGRSKAPALAQWTVTLILRPIQPILQFMSG